MTPEQKRRMLMLRQQQLSFGQAAEPQPRVVAEVADGQVIEAPDGTRSFTSPGYSTSDPAQIERLMGGATIRDEVQRGRDEQVLSEGGSFMPTVAKVAQGTPFIGQWLDEGLETVSPEGADQMREATGAMDRQRPGRAMAAELAGGVAGAVPLAISGVGAAMAAPTMLRSAFRGAALGGAAGAAEGAASAAGRAEDGMRGEAAVGGAAVGAGLGGIAGFLGPVVGEGAKELARRVKRLDVRTLASEFGLSMPAARRMRSALENDDLAAAAERLGRLGDDSMLADAGPATAQSLDDAMATGGRALRVARERVGERSAETQGWLTSKLDDILGPADGVRAAARDISQRTATARRNAYTRAYASPIDYAAPEGRQIEEVLSRVPAATFRRAVQEANEAMQAAGVRNQQILADIADDGTVTFREMPNVQQLDEIKKALGAIGREDIDQFGRPTGAGARARTLYRQLSDAIGEAVPSYRGAVRLGGDKIAEDNALDMGRNLLRSRTTFEDATDVLRGASDEAKAAARRGLRGYVEDTMSQVRTVVSDSNLDAREAMKLVKEMSSRANRKKIRLILGTDEAADLFQTLDKAEAALALRAAVSEKTVTALRTAGRESGRAELQPGPLREFLGEIGSPLEAPRVLTRRLMATDPRSMSQAEASMMAEIADTLTRLRGPEAQRALVAVREAMEGQPIKDADAALIGRLVGGAVAGSGYQAGQQIPALR